MNETNIKFFNCIVGLMFLFGIFLTLYGGWVTMIGGESLKNFKILGANLNKVTGILTGIATVYTIFILWDKERKFLAVILSILTFLSAILIVWGELLPHYFVQAFSNLEDANFKDDNDVVTSSYLFGGLAAVGFAASLISSKSKKQEGNE